jgi:hypothetical protein
MLLVCSTLYQQKPSWCCSWQNHVLYSRSYPQLHLGNFLGVLMQKGFCVKTLEVTLSVVLRYRGRSKTEGTISG